MRPEDDPVPLGLAECRLEVSCWPPKPVKRNISRHRGGQEDERVGSVWQAAGGLPCNPTLSHPGSEGQLADQWLLALVARWRAAGASRVVSGFKSPTNLQCFQIRPLIIKDNAWCLKDG